MFFMYKINQKTIKLWYNAINVNKSYILQDLEEEESDIVYKINIDGKEIIFYVLLEFQSTVVFSLDQEIDQEELIKRLRSLVYILKKISSE